MHNLWPFITRRVYILHGRQMVWLSRMHRKGLLLRGQRVSPSDTPFWRTRTYNRYIGNFFAVGAALFALASILMFSPTTPPGLTNLANITYFLGSIPFTIAASLQHFQSANTSAFPDVASTTIPATRIKMIGWQPRSAGWWSTFAQWLGTIAFNISTFNAISAPSEKLLDTLEIWGPNFEGSVLFLISGYLAFIEVSNKYWSWQPHSLSWRIVFINFAGCVAFMIAAVAPSTRAAHSLEGIFVYSDTYTLVGAICFFMGAMLLVRESERAAD